jgi:release factor glutamine methyltransferase
LKEVASLGSKEQRRNAERARLEQNLLFFRKIRGILAKGKIPAAGFEAEWLVLHFGNLGRLDFFTGRRGLSVARKTKAEQAARKRARGIPLGHLLKEAFFCGIKFLVNKNVLIPRPETEILVEETLQILKTEFPVSGANSPQILDVGTGSGCIAVSLTSQRPDCRMTALDISAKALNVARRNIRWLNLSGRIRLIRSDLFRSLGKKRRGFWDIIVTNPPYIVRSELGQLPRDVKREPRIALDGGTRGLEIIRTILKDSVYYLKDGGYLLIEIGKGQSALIRKWFGGQRIYSVLRFAQDFNGIERVAILKK